MDTTTIPDPALKYFHKVHRLGIRYLRGWNYFRYYHFKT